MLNKPRPTLAEIDAALAAIERLMAASRIVPTRIAPPRCPTCGQKLKLERSA